MTAVPSSAIWSRRARFGCSGASGGERPPLSFPLARRGSFRSRGSSKDSMANNPPNLPTLVCRWRERETPGMSGLQNFKVLAVQLTPCSRCVACLLAFFLQFFFNSNKKTKVKEISPGVCRGGPSPDHCQDPSHKHQYYRTIWAQTYGAALVEEEEMTALSVVVVGFVCMLPPPHQKQKHTKNNNKKCKHPLLKSTSKAHERVSS